MTDGPEEIEDLKDDDSDKDPLLEALRKAKEKRIVYPLTLTKEECLALGGQHSHGLGGTYFSDSYEGGKYETAEDHGNELWLKEGKAAFDAGKPCPICRGTGHYEVVCRGTETNFYFIMPTCCLCVIHRTMRQLLQEKLPENLRDFNINTLAPSPKSILPPSVQEREIAFLKKHVGESFFFLGPPGSSKSTYSAALFRASLWHDCLHRRGGYLWRVDGNHLFETEVAYATADNKSSVERDITPDEIYHAKRSGYRPVLLLEEIDKRKMTEFAANILFRLVNAMDECNGQLILTTNLTEQGFRNLFLNSAIEQVRVDGGALLRRLLENEKINVRDYHKQEE
jgi:DNA replication protein DnaC